MVPYLRLGYIWIYFIFSTLLSSNLLAQAQSNGTQQETTIAESPAFITTTEEPTTVSTTPEPPKIPVVKIAFYHQDPDAADSFRSFEAAVDYAKEKLSDKFTFEYKKIVSDGNKTSEELCQAWGDETPDIVIDFTRLGDPSEPVKKMVRWMQWPTISAAFGQEGDIKEWRQLGYNEKLYLIQVSPPADLVIQSMRSIVDHQNMTSGVLLFDEQYEMYHKYKSLLQNMPCRHLLTKVVRDIPGLRKQIDRLVHVDIANYFIAASLDEVTQYLIEASDPNMKDGPYFSDEFAWYSISLETGFPSCVGCRMNTSLVHLQPIFNLQSKNDRQKFLENRGGVSLSKMTEIFYFDLAVDAILSAVDLKKTEWTKPKNRCSDMRSRRDKEVVDLWETFKGWNRKNILGAFKLGGNGLNYPEFTMQLNRMLFNESAMLPYSNKVVGTWQTGFGEREMLDIRTDGLRPHVALTVFRVVTVVQPPFIYVNESCIKSKKDKYAANKCYTGYCIDLFKEIVKELNFNWTIYNVSEYGYMADEEPHEWNGMIRELKDRRADIALGALSVMAERESVVDFTVPYYDLVGISVLMKKQKAVTSLFKFLTVLENDVWMSILGSYFFTSFVIWVYDRLSPMSYHNNSEAYPNEEDQRDFNMKECLWFCMTSLTPQGGGEAPKNLSGRIVSAIWWLFGFIIIASYTANLAAFLTVSRLDAPVESLDDLSKQYKVQYAPVYKSPAWIYFERMSKIEYKFYEVWKDMTLNTSLPLYEQAMISVWNFPVSKKYTKLFQAMSSNRPPTNWEEGVQRVLGNYELSSDEFALLGEATDVKYMKSTNCAVKQVGEEFSRKPYAIAVQKGSPLKESFSHMILKLLNQRTLEQFKEVWWIDNKLTMFCPREEINSDGISIQNIGGVFIVIFVGIVMACFTLIFEYWWYRKRDVSQELTEMTLPTPKQYVSYFFRHERTEFDGEYNNANERPDVADIQPSW